MKIQGGKGASDLRSSLSSLTGDDVSVGTDRFFNAKVIETTMYETRDRTIFNVVIFM